MVSVTVDGSLIIFANGSYSKKMHHRSSNRSPLFQIQVGNLEKRPAICGTTFVLGRIYRHWRVGFEPIFTTTTSASWILVASRFSTTSILNDVCSDSVEPRLSLDVCIVVGACLRRLREEEKHRKKIDLRIVIYRSTRNQ